MRQKILALAAFCTLQLTAAAQAHPPRGIVVDASGRVYFSDLERIWMVDPRAGLKLVRPGVRGRHIHELALGADGTLYGEQQFYDPARQQWPSAIWKRSADGRISYVVPETRVPALGTSIWRDPQGCTLLADQSPAKAPLLFRRCPGRSPQLLFGRPADAASFRQVLLSNIGGVAGGPDGSFYFRHGATVRRLTRAGGVELVAANFTSENYGIAVGHDHSLYVVEHSARRVVRVAPDGKRSVAIASAAPWAPSGVAVRGRVIYVLETGVAGGGDGRISFRVRRLLPNRTAETIALLPPEAQRN